MIINGVMIDVAKLYEKDKLLAELRENGESDRALSKAREYYFETFGNELMWRYPISDGLHAGVFIVVVKEGFLCLPYDNMDTTEYEIFELDKAAMHDKDSLQIFIDDWRSFSDDLMGAMTDMLAMMKDRQ